MAITYAWNCFLGRMHIFLCFYVCGVVVDGIQCVLLLIESDISNTEHLGRTSFDLVTCVIDCAQCVSARIAIIDLLA